MARRANLLTDAIVKRALSQQRLGMISDGQGLYLRIRSGGGASWTFRYKRGTRDRWMHLGNARDVTLAEARKAARLERVKLDAGHDPLNERRTAEAKQRREGPFGALAEEWYVVEVQPRLKHPEIVRRSLDKYLLPRLGRLPLADVTPTHCSDLLNAVRARYPTTANDLLRLLQSIFAFGIRRHRLDYSPVAAFSARLDAGGPEKSRTRALTRTEIRRLFMFLHEERSFGEENLLLIKLLLALCVRKGELIEATWDEFDLDGIDQDGATWHLPSARSKTGAALDIPLAPTAVAWLMALKRISGNSSWVFPARRLDTRGSRSHMGRDTLNVALRRVSHDLEPFTVHDLRRTARTQLAELGVAPHVAELCLNHKPRGIEATYNRHSYFSQRRAALDEWTQLIQQLETKAISARDESRSA